MAMPIADITTARTSAMMLTTFAGYHVGSYIEGNGPSVGTAHPTISVAVIVGCGVQWKGNSPASSGTVRVASSPGATLTSKTPGSSEVTVWPTSSSLRIVTSEPAGTEVGT